jgi:hypothetical protein
MKSLEAFDWLVIIVLGALLISKLVSRKGNNRRDN